MKGSACEGGALFQKMTPFPASHEGKSLAKRERKQSGKETDTQPTKRITHHKDMHITEQTAQQRAKEHGMLNAYEAARRFGLSPVEALQDWDLFLYGTDTYDPAEDARLRYTRCSLWRRLMMRYIDWNLGNK